ncbi:uncharacterized protein NPIL_310831 [Nephila pilipes]|uniref:Uncharacterized protein n=1 Tax=Nephila pilipes TaxID=299642 RepID=A0A8X6PHI9_NEPPI|nr:uncharacterized protein NPIL_310831 [Nephila pilipes]
MHPTSRKKLIMKESRRRNVWKMCLTWKLLKSAVFVVCVTYFSWQSANFFQLYFAYPTRTNTVRTFPEVLIKPAVTICNTNPVKREVFCEKYPHLCQKPNNLTEFCNKHPYFCKDNVSNLVIPQLRYYTNHSTYNLPDALMEIYTHDITEDGAGYWSWKNPDRDTVNSKMKTIFLYDYLRVVYITCYSSNLQIYGSEDVETTHFDDELVMSHNRLNAYYTSIREEEAFFPWRVPRILLSIHSPFVPINSFDEGVVLEKNHVYIVNMRMEEEHLLQSPYQTDCKDYEDLWKKNNKTGPRSQEMCKEWCLWNYYTSCGNCFQGLTMVEKPHRFCTQNSCTSNAKIRVNLKKCRMNCKVNCKNLIYRYEIIDQLIGPYSTNQHLSFSDEIKISVIIKSPEVIVTSHKPVYTTLDAFSYIGGLMGCWLGLSVWACTGIAETTFLTILRFLKLCMKKSRHSAPVRNLVLFKRNDHSVPVM